MEREARDWFGHSFADAVQKSEPRNIVHDFYEKFASSSEAGSDLLSKFAKEHDERFMLLCSPLAPVGSYQRGGRDVIRSVSAGSGCGVPPLRTEEGGRYTMFMVSNRQMWSEKFSMSRSAGENHTNMCRLGFGRMLLRILVFHVVGRPLQ